MHNGLCWFEILVFVIGFEFDRLHDLSETWVGQPLRAANREEGSGRK